MANIHKDVPQVSDHVLRGASYSKLHFITVFGAEARAKNQRDIEDYAFRFLIPFRKNVSGLGLGCGGRRISHEEISSIANFNRHVKEKGRWINSIAQNDFLFFE